MHNSESYGLHRLCQGVECRWKEEISMLPKTVEYGLRAVVCLARAPEGRQSADQLAKATRVPRRYLHKVLQDLVKAGLVRSQSGPGGGYALTESAEVISILDVVNSVGSIERIRRCPLGLQSHNDLCPLHRELDKAYAMMEASFQRLTVAQVLDPSDSPSPLCDAVANQ
jgi:Rrf2 family transcriptional regulator, nitric oxide-sensitive transcriptional repressor